MRDKSLLQLFLILNVALAACFGVYLFVSTSREHSIPVTTFTLPGAKSNDGPGFFLSGGGTNGVGEAATNSSPAGTGTNAAAAVAVAAAGSGSATNGPAGTNTFTAVFTDKRVGWEQMDADSKDSGDRYKTYMDSLRAVGCPEEKVRYIVLADIGELCGKKRLKEAVTHDVQWWRSEPELTTANTLQQAGRSLEEERRVLIAKYLGPDAAEGEKGEAMLWSNVQLTGPVLGNLPPETHNAVQEICGRSIERHQGAFWARVNDGQALNQVEMAKLREQTRADLRKVLNSEGMEEFLLRYSHNAHELRNELRGFDATPEEFRKMFRAIDSMQHQLQNEYGGPEVLSQQQRDRFFAQRDSAIKEALGPRRYQDYLMVKDPLYRQAQLMALQYGAPPKAILPLYQMFKTNDSRRQKVLNDASLTPQQKNEQLNLVNQEQMRSVQQIVADSRK